MYYSNIRCRPNLVWNNSILLWFNVIFKKDGELMKGYITLKEASERWNLSVRWINMMCSQNRIPGAEQIGRVWIIPEDTICPTDA